MLRRSRLFRITTSVFNRFQPSPHASLRAGLGDGVSASTSLFAFSQALDFIAHRLHFFVDTFLECRQLVGDFVGFAEVVDFSIAPGDTLNVFHQVISVARRLVAMVVIQFAGVFRPSQDERVIFSNGTVQAAEPVYAVGFVGFPQTGATMNSSR